MRNYFTIFLILVLLFSNVIIEYPNSNSFSDSIQYLGEITKGSSINYLEETTNLKNLNKITGYFTQNQGQIDNNSVSYYIHGKGVWFLNDGVVFEIREYDETNEIAPNLPAKNRIFKDKIISENPIHNKPTHPALSLPEGWRSETEGQGTFKEGGFKPMERFCEPVPPKYKIVVLKLIFEGANQVIPEGQGLLSHRSNFFYGNDSSKWCTNVPNYEEIVYKNLYKNIDLRYYTTPYGLKYDFVLHPNSKINDIRLRYKGIQDIYSDNFNNLRIKTPLGEFIDSNLLIYQDIEIGNKIINGEFKIINSNTYGFKINSEYDRTQDLIIDPLLYSTYVGGNNPDWGSDIAVNTNGNAYVTGNTNSMNFPNTTGVHDNSLNGGDDVFVFKLNPTGSNLIYSTYIGGDRGEAGAGIEIDANGNVYIAGLTRSSNFPFTSGAFDTINDKDDVFVLKLNPSGSKLEYSTFVGGSKDDWGENIAIDTSGNAYVTGWTESSDFPNTTGTYDNTLNGGEDVIVFKLNPSGSDLIYSTYIGGSNNEWGLDIALDDNNSAYVTGFTLSNDFPNTTGAYNNTLNGDSDVFICKLNETGTDLYYSTYIGGYNQLYYETGFGIEVDSLGNAYVTGVTNSSSFPTTEEAYNKTKKGVWLEAFALKLNSNGSDLIYSTYIGGNLVDAGYDITIDLEFNAYITGNTYSYDFPNTTGAFDRIHNGGTDIFVLKLDHIGSSIIYSTYIGGGNLDRGFSIKIDNNNNAYVTGITDSGNFPISNNAYDKTHNGVVYDIFVLKLNLTNTYPPIISDLKISDSAVLRTNSIHIYSNASDLEELEEHITPIFEYRDPNKQVWNKTYLSNQIYNNSRWEISFTPPKDAILGLYDFRVRFNDSEMRFSSWLYLNDSLTILNNNPRVENISLSRDLGILGDKISIWINGSDVEQSENNLTIEFEYLPPGDQSWNTTYLDDSRYINDRWEYNFSIPFEAPFGYYDLRGRVNDSDGDYSKWLYINDSLLVYNKRPMVMNFRLSENSIYRTNSVFLFANGKDHEAPEPMLCCGTQYKPEGENEWADLIAEYSKLNARWEIEFYTDKNSTLGVYDFRIRFIDNSSESSEWFYLNNSLEVLNNLPSVLDLNVSESDVYRTQSIIIKSNGTDIETPENLLACEVQYKSSTGNWELLNGSNYVSDHWEANFTPSKNAELGSYALRINFTDADTGISGWTWVENAFEVLNNLPIISDSCDNFIVNATQIDFDLTEYESDIEDLDEDLTWDVDQATVDESLFTAGITNFQYDILRIIPKHDIIGSDEITLILTDSDDGVCKKTDVTVQVNSTINIIHSVSISVSPKYIELEPGEGQEVRLTIDNLGNIADKYILSIESDDIISSDILFETSTLLLQPGEKKNVTVNVTLPDNIKGESTKITFLATSEHTSDNTTLIIKIITERTVDKDNNTWLLIIIAIIVFIIILIVVFQIIRRRKHSEQKHSLVKPELAKPSEPSIEERSQEEITTAPVQPQLGDTGTTAEPPLIEPTVPTVPQLAGSGQPSVAPTDQQIPQTTQAPQLLPSQQEASEITENSVAQTITESTPPK